MRSSWDLFSIVAGGRSCCSLGNSTVFWGLLDGCGSYAGVTVVSCGREGEGG